MTCWQEKNKIKMKTNETSMRWRSQQGYGQNIACPEFSGDVQQSNITNAKYFFVFYYKTYV